MMRLTLLSAGLLLFLALIQPSAAPAADFAGLTVTTISLKDDRGRPLPDQASLRAVLERVFDLNIPLVSLQRERP